MFEGTDLSMAYGAMYETPISQAAPASVSQSAPSAPPKPVLMSNPPPPPAVDSASKSHAMPPEVAYVPPQDMYLQQSATAAPASFQGESFWDRISSKRWEVLKLVVFALVILLALSLDQVVSHYLTNYLTTSFLTNFQEVMVRLAYPIAVILLLWIIKASA